MTDRDMLVREAAQPEVRGSELDDGSLLIVGFEDGEPDTWIQSQNWVEVPQ